MAKAAPVEVLTDKEINQIEILSGVGLTIEKIAAVIGISKRTLERRLKATPKAADALLKGRAQAESQIAMTAFQMAVSGKNPTMTIFWLKTRARWKEADADLPSKGDADEDNPKEQAPRLIVDLSGKHVEPKK